MRILIADDHAVFRRGLKETLSEAFSKIIFGEARTAQETLEFAGRQDWDVIILDISMPGKSGLDILDDLRRLRPRIPVLLLTMHPEQQFARRALKAGAAGYLNKDTAAELLVGAIRKIAAGGVHIGEAAAASLVAAERSPHETLSDREFEVLRLLVDGLGPTEIGERLHLSVKTVSTHKTRILEKLNVRSTAELVRYALEHGLVELTEA